MYCLEKEQRRRKRCIYVFLLFLKLSLMLWPWIVLVLEKWILLILHFVPYDGINCTCPKCFSFLHCRHLQLNLFVCAVVATTDIIKSAIHVTKCWYYRKYVIHRAMHFIITSTDLLATASAKENQGVLLRSRWLFRLFFS